MSRKSKGGAFFLYVVAIIIAGLVSALAPAANGGQKSPKSHQQQDSSTERIPEPEWVKSALRDVSEKLAENSPIYPATLGRWEALSVLDGPLHLSGANQFTSVQRFLRRRLGTSIRDIENCHVTTGAVIWKMYNMGFVIRTPSVTIGMDIVRGWTLPHKQRAGITTRSLNRLVRQLDIASVSHRHRDHADEWMPQATQKIGVPLLADASVFPDTSSPLLIRPERADTSSTADFNSMKGRSGAIIEYIALPGHQAPNTIDDMFLFRTPEGLTILHTGDEDWSRDWGWIDRIHEKYHVDILIANCWNQDLARLVAGVKPGLVLTGHENEMAHATDHRETFWQSLKRMIAIPHQPNLVLCWGERTSYPVRVDSAALAKENAARAVFGHPERMPLR
jgi:hypothetical protein